LRVQSPTRLERLKEVEQLWWLWLFRVVQLLASRAIVVHGAHIESESSTRGLL